MPLYRGFNDKVFFAQCDWLSVSRFHLFCGMLFTVSQSSAWSRYIKLQPRHSSPKVWRPPSSQPISLFGSRAPLHFFQMTTCCQLAISQRFAGNKKSHHPQNGRCDPNNALVFFGAVVWIIRRWFRIWLVFSFRLGFNFWRYGCGSRRFCHRANGT